MCCLFAQQSSDCRRLTQQDGVAKFVNCAISPWSLPGRDSEVGSAQINLEKISEVIASEPLSEEVKRLIKLDSPGAARQQPEASLAAARDCVRL